MGFPLTKEIKGYYGSATILNGCIVEYLNIPAKDHYLYAYLPDRPNGIVIIPHSLGSTEDVIQGTVIEETVDIENGDSYVIRLDFEPYPVNAIRDRDGTLIGYAVLIY